MNLIKQIVNFVKNVFNNGVSTETIKKAAVTIFAASIAFSIGYILTPLLTVLITYFIYFCVYDVAFSLCVMFLGLCLIGYDVYKQCSPLEEIPYTV